MEQVISKELEQAILSLLDNNDPAATGEAFAKAGLKTVALKLFDRAVKQAKPDERNWKRVQVADAIEAMANKTKDTEEKRFLTFAAARYCLKPNDTVPGAKACWRKAAKMYHAAFMIDENTQPAEQKPEPKPVASPRKVKPVDKMVNKFFDWYNDNASKEDKLFFTWRQVAALIGHENDYEAYNKFRNGNPEIQTLMTAVHRGKPKQSLYEFVKMVRR